MCIRDRARRKDEENKDRMKKYKDEKYYVKPHTIKEGDKVMLERKSTKKNSPYDPKHYEVVEVIGTQIKAKREESIKVRDAQKWKVVKPQKLVRFHLPKKDEQVQDADIGPPRTTAAPPPDRIIPATPANRASRRTRIRFIPFQAR